MWKTVTAFLVFLATASAWAVQSPEKDAYVRVVDVGPGLCTVTEVPGDSRMHYMVYDAGHWDNDRCLLAVNEIVGKNEIDLMVLSHSDADHLSDAAEILVQYKVKHIIRTGMERKTYAWCSADREIHEEV